MRDNGEGVFFIAPPHCCSVLQSEHIKEARDISRGFRKLQRRIKANQTGSGPTNRYTSLHLAHDTALTMWTFLLVVLATGSPALLQAAPVQGE